MTGDPTPCPRCGQPHARCAAHKRDGSPCGQPAMTGQRVCKMHGGKKPAAVANAERRLQESAAEDLLRRTLWNPSATPVTDSVGEMQRLAGAMRQAADVLGKDLDAGDLHEVRATAWLRVLRELRQLLADMKRLGIAEYAVNVEATRVRLMAVAFGRALDALEGALGQSLPEDARDAATSVLLTELRAQAQIDAGEAS